MIFEDGPITVELVEIEKKHTNKYMRCTLNFYFNSINSTMCSSYNFSKIDKELYDYMFMTYYSYFLISNSHYYTVYFNVKCDTGILITYKYNGLIELGLSCLRNVTQDIPYYSKAICTYSSLNDEKVLQYEIARDQSTKIMNVNVTHYISLFDVSYFIQALNQNKSLRNMPYASKIYVTY